MRANQEEEEEEERREKILRVTTEGGRGVKLLKEARGRNAVGTRSRFFFSLRRARASERVFLNQNEKSMLSSSGVYVWLRAVSTTDEKSCC